ncbi:MAG: ribonuclease III [Minisyncoccales bacterium]
MRKTMMKKKKKIVNLKKIEEKFSLLESKLNIFFENKNLLFNAFCHRSFLNETNSPFPSYENLEFLGDAVLSLIITEYLYLHFYQTKKEGELSYLRAFLVNKNKLAECSRKLGFDKYLLLSVGEEKAGGRKNDNLLANVFESFLASLYLDKGYKICQKFVEQHLILNSLEEIKKGKIKDFKTMLQEKAQKILGETPVYKLIQEWGPDHNKFFLVGVFLGKKKIAQGEGRSKKEASEQAAQKALEIKDWQNVKN